MAAVSHIQNSSAANAAAHQHLIQLLGDSADGTLTGGNTITPGNNADGAGRSLRPVTGRTLRELQQEQLEFERYLLRTRESKINKILAEIYRIPREED